MGWHAVSTVTRRDPPVSGRILLPSATRFEPSAVRAVGARSSGRSNTLEPPTDTHAIEWPEHRRPSAGGARADRHRVAPAAVPGEMVRLRYGSSHEIDTDHDSQRLAWPCCRDLHRGAGAEARSEDARRHWHPGTPRRAQ